MRAHRLLLSAAITGVLITGFTGLGPAAASVKNWAVAVVSAFWVYRHSAIDGQMDH